MPFDADQTLALALGGTAALGTDFTLAHGGTLTLGFGQLPDRVNAGAGSSLAVTLVDDDGPPGPPAGLAAGIGDGSIRLTWNAPEPPDDSPVDGYRVNTDGGAWTEVGAATEHTVSNLVNGTQYSFEVQARNRHGWGGFALNLSKQTRPPLLPQAPQELMVPTDDSSRATLEWMPPSNAYDWHPPGADLESVFRDGEPAPGFAAALPSSRFASASHDGASGFTFGLTFSEEVKLSYRTLRDAAFAVTGGAVTKAQRSQPGSNAGWTITVEPAAHGAVAISLPATGDCAAGAAICTHDGRPLSHGLSATVAGPPGLAAADARASEGPNVALEFSVTLDRASPRAVTVDYATADGAAQAGTDYTAASGTLTFAAGARSKTVTVTVLDDGVNEGGRDLLAIAVEPVGRLWRTPRRRARSRTRTRCRRRGWRGSAGRRPTRRCGRYRTGWRSPARRRNCGSAAWNRTGR